MARSPSSWGIDIGKCAIKALRGRLSPEDPRKFVAESFDYVEYPMLLSQPEADPVELVRTALEEFTQRNDLRGTRVAVSVPGQLGLTKFIKLPPIEARKIPDIVRYEARQQIPFPLEQVNWDWQRVAGGFEEGGFVIDAEVAIVAIKRDQVAKALEPLQVADVEVDILQLSPLALANMVAFDQLPPVASFDPDNPPPAIVLVSIGVDTSDLVITNGLKIWQRSLPIGGSNFTKALVKDMQLTFAKAENIKRNAVRSEDPRAVFGAMRPVFKDFAAEVQRSLNYYTGTDKTATIGRVLLAGNAAKLRGLTDFVTKQLQAEVQRLDSFRALEGPAVVNAPSFRENRLAFGTAYGLALQAAGPVAVGTNLMPREILRDRMIAAKRPWAVAALASLLVACIASFAGLFLAWQTFAAPGFEPAFARADAVSARSRTARAAVEENRQRRDAAIARQLPIAELYERRFQTLDMLRTLEAVLPRDTAGATPEDPADRREIHVDSLDCEFYPELGAWFTAVKRPWRETHAVRIGDEPPEPAAPAEPAAPTDAAADPAAATAGAGEGQAAGEDAGPQGPGWVVQIVGHHFHNEDRHKPDEDEQFVRSTLIRGLLGKGASGRVSAGPLAGTEVRPADVGIAYPVIVASKPVQSVEVEAEAAAGAGVAGGGGAETPAAAKLKLRRYDFTVQFCWQPVVPGAPAAPSPAPTP
jgi:type IV pilus assembly protein PilM